MSSPTASGSCLCGNACYKISGNIDIFQYCHCSRCRKISGSGHASNLFVSPSDFSWLKGEALIKRYEPENTKYFATAFCERCGSSMPWLSKNKKVVIVPAGTLDEDPGIKPSQNIFWDSKADWFVCSNELAKHSTLPKT